MKRFEKWALTCLAATASPLILAPAAHAQVAPAVAAAATYSSDTQLGTLLDNPQTKAVLDKYIHEMISNPQIDMARSMTLRQLQAYAGDTLTDEKLKQIDADLAKVPPAK